jgi:hypothetical protein
MRQGTALLVLMAMLAAPALAEPPASSLRPIPRPGIGAADTPLEVQALALAVSSASRAAPARSFRPLPRPVAAATSAAVSVAPPRPQPPETVVAAGFVPKRAPLAGLIARLRPAPRPEAAPEAEDRVQPAAAVRVLPGRSAVVGRKGSVCGVNGIRGETLAPVTSRVRGCGIADPVRVTQVDGVALSVPATLDCPTARALHDWVRGALKPAFGRTDVVGLEVAAHYACRSRNNVRGAKISEHGRGKAIDISAVVLENGKTVSVLDDWRRRAGRPLVKAYRGACGTFGTTLGPDADRHHRDHIHLDTARHRSGSYCR